MKKIIFFLTVLSSPLSFAYCENEISIINEGKDIKAALTCLNNTISNQNKTPSQSSLSNTKTIEKYLDEPLSIGIISLKSNDIFLHEILDRIPRDAKEVKVMGIVFTGQAGVRYENSFIKIFTKNNSDIAKAFFIYLRPYETQDAVSYNSDSEWLPIHSGRQILTKYTGGAIPKNSHAELFLVAYR